MYLLAGQTQTYFVYAGRAAWQLAQEYDSPTKVAATDPAKDSALEREYVYGNYIDEVVQKTVDIDGDGLTVSYLCTGGVSGESSKPTTPHQDDQFTVYAVTDDLGAVVERYVYGDYGNVMIYDAADQLCDTSCIGNRHMYTGRLLDAHSGLYQYRHRYYMPSIGKFIQRDPLGVWGDLLNLGSPSAYVASSPFTYMDPSGLFTIPWYLAPLLAPLIKPILIVFAVTSIAACLVRPACRQAISDAISKLGRPIRRWWERKQQRKACDAAWEAKNISCRGQNEVQSCKSLPTTGGCGIFEARIAHAETCIALRNAVLLACPDSAWKKGKNPDGYRQQNEQYTNIVSTCKRKLEKCLKHKSRCKN